MNDLQEQIREKRNQKVNGVLRYFNLIMGAFYLFAGLLIFFYPPQSIQLSENTKWVISIALILYGSFRIYRILKK